MICIRIKPLSILLCLIASMCSGSSIAGEKKSETLPLPTELIGGVSKKYNPTYIVTVESVFQKLKQKKSMILVDVRENAAFKKFRIPGSMNIPLFALKTKKFLKSKHLILVNEGFRYSELGEQCKRLRDSGFLHVSILFGGLQGWLQKGGVLEGDIFSQKDLNRVSAGDFYEERIFENLVVINSSEVMRQEASALIPQSAFAPYLTQENNFVSQVRNIIHQRRQNPLTLILIYNQDGKYPENMITLLQGAGIRNVFFLESGLEGYKRFLQQQAQLLKAKNERKVVKKCASCP